jgi:hypothetical protein
MTKDPPRTGDSAARAAVEGRDKAHAPAKPAEKPPTAGAHAEPSLQNPEATPGAGTLTPSGEHGDMDSTSS